MFRIELVLDAPRLAAVEGLKTGSGITSDTIHSRLFQWEQGRNRPGPGDVLVLDETGMIGSRQIERLLHFAEAGGAKIVLVGDARQLQAIEAGGAFRAISERIGAASLRTARSQKADWQKDATAELADGRTASALARYEAAGMVHGPHPRPGETRAMRARSWWSSWAPPFCRPISAWRWSRARTMPLISRPG